MTALNDLALKDETPLQKKLKELFNSLGVIEQTSAKKGDIIISDGVEIKYTEEQKAQIDFGILKTYLVAAQQATELAIILNDLGTVKE